MITLRRATERPDGRRRARENWLSFSPFDEHHLPPAATVPRHPPHEAEIVTYVREGALAYEDSAGRSGVVQAGEFERMSAERGVRRRETNPSRSEWAHVFKIWLRPSQADIDPGYQQMRFSAGERRGALRVVASHDGRRGSLLVRQDALVYSVTLHPGQHVAHELARGRRAWLHLVQGSLTLVDLVLGTGDGARVTAERAVSFTARDESEVLLLDLP